MANYKSISEWQDKNNVSLEEFFIPINGHTTLYDDVLVRFEAAQDAIKRGETVKAVPYPIEQLSPKGLALVSYLYSEKDHDEAQPVIASTTKDFMHVVKLIDDAPPGTNITLIAQFTDVTPQSGYLLNRFGRLHKIVCKLERGEQDIRMTLMDSLSNPMYQVACQGLFEQALNENAETKKRQKTSRQVGLQEDTKDDERKFTRQSDRYQCGVFAIRDARFLNRDTEISNIYLNPDPAQSYKCFALPPQYYKSVQSRTFAEHILQDPLFAGYGETAVDSKGRTLKQKFEKYLEHGYVHHFSEKYRDQVNEFVRTHSAAKIKSCVAKYDAKEMTIEKLIAVYGPNARLKAQQEKSDAQEKVTPPITLGLYKQRQEKQEINEAQNSASLPRERPGK